MHCNGQVESVASIEFSQEELDNLKVGSGSGPFWSWVGCKNAWVVWLGLHWFGVHDHHWPFRWEHATYDRDAWFPCIQPRSVSWPVLHVDVEKGNINFSISTRESEWSRKSTSLTFTCLFVQTSGYVMMRRGLFLLQKVLSNGPDPYIGIRTSTSSEPRQEFLIDDIIGWFMYSWILLPFVPGIISTRSGNPYLPTSSREFEVLRSGLRCAWNFHVERGKGGFCHVTDVGKLHVWCVKLSLTMLMNPEKFTIFLSFQTE